MERDKQQNNTLLSKIQKFGKYYLVDSTSGLTESTPIFAAFETQIVGMSPEVSMNARLYTAGLTYLGTGYLFAKGRDSWRSMLNVNDESSNKVQGITDSLYGGLFTLAICPPLYMLSGSRDFKEIALASVVSAGLATFNGFFAGYAIDLGRDLTGVKESARIPKTIKNRSKTFKRTLALGLVAASLALTAGVYSLSENKIQDRNENPIVNSQQAILNSREDNLTH
ncbi:MAG: hypothetical protein AABX03_02965 [Nanoarchaeota archaeon]